MRKASSSQEHLSGCISSMGLRHHHRGITPLPVLPPENAGVCALRGAAIDKQLCKTCQGSVYIKIFECSKFEKCTDVNKFPEIHACKGCDSKVIKAKK